MLYGRVRSEPVAQGDLFRGLRLYRRRPSEAPDALPTDLGLVLAHDCDFTKVERALPRDRLGALRLPLTVAPVYDSAVLVGGKDKQAMSGSILRYFPMPSEGGHPDRVADLWVAQPVAAGDLLKADRIACLSESAVIDLRVHLVRRFTRHVLNQEDIREA